MALKKIVEKFIPAALLRNTMFAPQGEQLRSTPWPPASAAEPPSATVPGPSEGKAPRGTTVFDLVLQAYVTSPGMD